MMYGTSAFVHIVPALGGRGVLRGGCGVEPPLPALHPRLELLQPGLLPPHPRVQRLVAVQPCCRCVIVRVAGGVRGAPALPARVTRPRPRPRPRPRIVLALVPRRGRWGDGGVDCSVFLDCSDRPAA